MKISIVTTLYQSANYINEFCTRAASAARLLAGDSFEIILVNDGSPDNSLDISIQIASAHNYVTVVDLSRNFGHHKAMMTGLSQAKGELIFLIDSDLEEEPEWLISFDAQMKLDNCDVVFGVQGRRKGTWFERLSGHLFYVFFNFFSGFHLQKNITTVRLMTRRYVDSLLLHREREVLIAGLWHITGFEQRFQLINKHSTSKTTYTFSKKLSLLINSITSFSNAPLVGIFYLGLFIFLLSLIYVFHLVANWFYFEKPLNGWTSVMASIWLIGGMIISFIGVIGIYLSKIYSETKSRPYTIIRNIYNYGNRSE